MEYQTYQIFKEKEFEDICQRCGNCCGVQEDPCMHLVKKTDDTYLCDIYDSRGGMQKTHSGKFFNCVSIREILHADWPGISSCAYRKKTDKSFPL